jgi:hypothetical protein
MKHKLLFFCLLCFLLVIGSNSAQAQFVGNWSGLPTAGVCPGQSTTLVLGSLPSTITGANNPLLTGCRITAGPTLTNNNGVITVALTVVWLVGNDQGTIEMTLVNTSNGNTTSPPAPKVTVGIRNVFNKQPQQINGASSTNLPLCSGGQPVTLSMPIETFVGVPGETINDYVWEIPPTWTVQWGGLVKTDSELR